MTSHKRCCVSLLKIDTLAIWPLVPLIDLAVNARQACPGDVWAHPSRTINGALFT